MKRTIAVVSMVLVFTSIAFAQAQRQQKAEKSACCPSCCPDGCKDDCCKGK